VSLRARRLGIPGDRVAFVSGRELGPLVDAARAERPFLLAVDSIQSLRDSAGGQVPGGPAQVRCCTDALVGLAKAERIAVLLAGHLTKDGDVAGPRREESRTRRGAGVAIESDEICTAGGEQHQVILARR
jgi:DNA repair protein RadA/Sms